MEPKLETEALSYSVGNEAIIEDISFAVPEQSVVAIIGPSGAGKSSLLRLLNRLDEPTGGTVYLDGVDYREIEPQRLRRRVGYVPQEATLRSGTVTENVTTGPRLRGESIDRDRASKLLSRVDLAGYGDRAIEALSGGERQRVAIARSVFNCPEVLLLDEPTASLDANVEQQVEALLMDLIPEFDLTCCLVTHDHSQAQRLADRVARIEGGRLRQFDTPSAVIE
ncbi:ABC transporter ATP-binding protein [Halocatena halophila]|uniref:ABC transporter ATP-binding protein n=1 Tax=Halocatena halophila TaxID=2814576 RepID=UPI002ED35480